MIKNERQYRTTKAQAEDALRSQIADLEDELREYESLKAGGFQLNGLNVLFDLSVLLIKARISQGLSQRELAERIGVKEQQVQRYEATDYASASLTRIREVASALGRPRREAYRFLSPPSMPGRRRRRCCSLADGRRAGPFIAMAQPMPTRYVGQAGHTSLRRPVAQS